MSQRSREHHNTRPLLAGSVSMRGVLQEPGFHSHGRVLQLNGARKGRGDVSQFLHARQAPASIRMKPAFPSRVAQSMAW